MSGIQALPACHFHRKHKKGRIQLEVMYPASFKLKYADRISEAYLNCAYRRFFAR